LHRRILRAVLKSPVQLLFPGEAFGPFHGDGFGRAGYGAETAGGAAFAHVSGEVSRAVADERDYLVNETGANDFPTLAGGLSS